MVYSFTFRPSLNMSSNHHQIKSPEHLQEILSLDLGAVSVLYFRADWAQPCEQMDVVIENLAKRWTDVVFLSVRSSFQFVSNNLN